MSYNTRLSNINTELEELLNDINNLRTVDKVDIATPSISVSGNGLITASVNQEEGLVDSGSKSATKQLTTQNAKTITPNTGDQTAVNKGVYTTGAITVKGDSNLKSENIVSGVSIFGVSGTATIGGGGGSNSGNDTLNGLITRTITEISNNEVTSVGSYTFINCTKLTTVDLPVCTSIGSSAFNSCATLSSVNLPACKNVGYYAFYGCSKLTAVDLPVCTSIGGYAFRSCTTLPSIDLPACKSVGYNAFHGCSKLTAVDLPVCTSIGSYAFRNCTTLPSIDLPVCTSLGNQAFSECAALSSINLPVCTSIGSYTFNSCVKLTTLILKNSSVVTLASSDAFTSTPMSISTLTGSFGSIYVPSSLVDAYKVASNWSVYADRITAIVS